MTEAPVLFDTLPTASGHLFGRATLNAPASLNALSLAMVDLLALQLAAWAADDRVVGVMLDGAGEKALCAGGDIVELVGEIRRLHQQQPGAVPPHATEFFEREYRLDYQIHTYPKPFLVWGHGIVMGGGIGLMAGGSHRIVTPKTRLAMPEVGIGLFPDVGGSWFLSRLPGRTGAFLALTGAPLNAADALFAGLADFALGADDRKPLLTAIRAAHWQGARGADGAQLSHLIRQLAAQSEGEGRLVLPASPLRTHLDRINAVIDHDELADIAPRLAALASDPDPWLAHAGAALTKGSPTSAVLSLEMQRRCRHASLAESFRLEFQAAVGCCAREDFAEGVRALLIDKDKSPRWRPATLAEVTPAVIDDVLRPRFDGPHPLADLH
jgi:enoyl-CoA hydratase/carnithine racemase